ncbi:MAG: hypothetical protein KatS3mg025_0002 [Bacteroidia bacterium]|nr:MAG: hypothetical protein KatS3mg025_0002 [Bacteroidia bacterium]
MNQVYHTVFLGIFLIGILLLFFTYPCWVIDKGYGIFRGLGAAARLTIHNVGPVFLFILSIIGINFLGGLAFGVGLLVTVPWTMIAMAGLYKSLAGEGSAEAAQAS